MNEMEGETKDGGRVSLRLRDGGRPTKISMLFSKGFDDAP